MTKKIRVENADVSPYPVTVEVWNKSAHKDEPDVLLSTHTINTPAQMVELYIHQHAYLVVKEGS